MADEIAKEVQMGRMDGPFTAPTWWDVPAVALTCHPHTRQLKPLPHPTQLSRWPSAYTRPAQMVNPRLDVEKTGGGAAITDPATWQTNLTITLQTIMYGLHSTPAANT